MRQTSNSSLLRKKYQDGRVESSGELKSPIVLRLMQTIFAGGELPQSGKDLMDKLDQKKEAEIKAKAEQEEMEAKKLKMRTGLRPETFIV